MKRLTGELDLADYLDRLEARYDEREPAVLAFLPEDGRFDRLRREARAIEGRGSDPAARPPLAGLPIGVKDIFHVEGFVTHAGSQLPEEVLQGTEAESVAILRRAGALIMGKTVTTEFAYFGPGPTRNPHHPGHTPGGSSSGSAAAVGAGLCEFALGTQTIGSVIRPAAFCGVVGFKPSYGRISTAGIIPLSPSLDHVGTFTVDVADAALMAATLCRDWRDEPSPEGKPVLGIPIGPYLDQAAPDGLAHFRADCNRLVEAGYAIKPVEVLDDFEEVRGHHLRLMAAEAARTHARWFDEFGTRYHPKTSRLIRDGRRYNDDEIQTAQARQMAVRERLTEIMDRHDLDLWISPPATGAAPAGLESTGDPVMNLPWTFAGLPVMSLPSGANEAGLPLGLQLTGRWGEDERLLSHAKTVEDTLNTMERSLSKEF